MRMGLVHPQTWLQSGRGKEKAAAVLCHSLLQDLEQTLFSSFVSRRALQKAFPLGVLQTFFTCHCLARSGGLRGMLTVCSHLAFTHCI